MKGFLKGSVFFLGNKNLQEKLIEITDIKIIDGIKKFM